MPENREADYKVLIVTDEDEADQKVLVVAGGAAIAADLTGAQPGDVLVVQDDGSLAPSPNGLLAITSYGPNPGVVRTTDLVAFTDVDAALAVTFSAPASGRVLVRLSALVVSEAGASYIRWNLRDANGDVAGTARSVSQNPPTNVSAVPVPILVGGLTPGQSYTWKWGHASSVPGQDTSLAAGDFGGNADGLHAVMEVWAAPPA